jgi:mono/diheme cytochrome c family protein
LRRAHGLYARCRRRIFSKETLTFVAALLALALASGCGGWNIPPDARNLKNPVLMNAATIAAARGLYANNCQKCHGVSGDGKPPSGATYLYFTKPTNFTNSRLIDSMSDGEIFWKISNGRKPMPAFKNRLNDEQRWKLVNLIRVFAHPAQK